MGQNEEDGLSIVEGDAKGCASIRKYYLACFCATLGTIAMGMTIGYSSPGLPSLRENNRGIEFTVHDGDTFSGILLLGALSGSLVTGKLTNRYGFRDIFLGAAFILVCGWQLIVMAISKQALYAGRLVSGIAIGILSAAAPVYVADIAPSNIRGYMSLLCNVGIPLGVEMSYVAGKWLDWVWLSIAGMTPAVILILAFPKIADSPRWLLKKGWIKEANEALRFHYGTDIATATEIANKGLQPEVPSTEPVKPTLNLWHDKAALRPFIYAQLLMVFQQLSGVNVLVFNTEAILRQSGLISVNPKDGVIFVGAVQIVVTASASFLVDSIGRKPLLLVSSVTSAASLLGLGIAYSWKSLEHLEWVPLVCVTLFFVSFSLGLGPIPWVLMGEIIPDRIKSSAAGVCMSIMSLTGFAVTASYHVMLHTMGESWTFWFYAFNCIVGTVFIAFCVPETRGKTLEEIEEFFQIGNEERRLVNDQNQL